MNFQGDHMLVVLVHVHVKPEFVDAFIKASKENASNSIKEVGIARFDVIQQIEDPTRFTLVEVYRDQQATAAHKETAHYKVWRDTVADWMADPRNGVKYESRYPEDTQW
jgi:(4S)-4-hydroxy-5-phosphonooxypentane-2,3-dione isomerase